MAKYSAEELSSKINDLDLDDALKISLMEDVTDSVSPEDSRLAEVQTELEKVKSEYDDLKEKYKTRFLETKEIKPVKQTPVEELEERKIIDIREI